MRASAVLGLLAAPASAEQAAALDQDAIAYRKHVMRTLEAQFNALTHIIAQGGPAENLVSHLETALMTARMVLPSFKKHAPGGAAQPHIWEKWSDYTAHAQEFEAAIAVAVEAAKHNSVTQVIWYTDQVSCKKCHDAYLQPRVRGRELDDQYRGY